MNKHDEKHIKRIVRELRHWRTAIVRSFNEVNRHRFGEERGQKVREKVDRDRKLIKHIDHLLVEASELLGRDLPELEKVPRVTIRKV